jgi:hypothetical protein
MAIETKHIDDYLARYAQTLTDLDAHAAAALWSTPGMIADDALSGVLDSREAMIEGLEQSYPLYTRLGLASVSHELLEEKQLSDRLVLVRVRFLLLDEQEELLTDTTSYYLLRDEDSTLRAFLCVETDAAQKLSALAEQRGIDLPAPPTDQRPVS